MRVYIYHTNDIHSNYEFLKRVHHYLRVNKSENDLYFDSGDYTDLKNVIVQADQGQSAMEMLMSCGLDGMTLGNNEVDMGYEAVSQLVNQGAPMIVANVTDNQDNLIENMPVSKLFVRAGKRFLVIGIAPYYKEDMTPSGYNVFSMMGNLKFHPPVELVRKELDKEKGNYDYCILLSHSGYIVDEKMRKELPEVDLWLGGHSHEVKSQKGYSQSGMGEFLGKITLEINGDEITEVENEQLTLPEAQNKEFEELLQQKEKLADKILSKELPVIRDLEFNPFRESELINYVCDCLLKKFGGDLAIMHCGIAENSMARPVSRKSLVATFPSKLNPTFYTIKGEGIIEAIKLSFDEAHIREDGRGPGFRGHVLGTLGFSANVRISRNPFYVEVDGKRVEKDREYKIVTDDYLQRGTGYPSLRVPNERAQYHKWFIRDLAQHYLMDSEVFEMSKIKREVNGASDIIANNLPGLEKSR